MKSPVVSIITPLRNAEPFVRETLASLLGQTFADFELLVIDDGSTDAGPQIVRDTADSRIRLLATSDDSGPAAARNLGLDETRGDFIAFADADDLALPERLAMQLGMLRKEPALGFVGSRVEVIDERGSPTGDTWGFEGVDVLLPPILLFRNVLATSTLLFRRSCLGEARFRTDLPVASDYELWARLAPAHTGRVLDETLVKYRVHSTNLTQRRQADAAPCLRQIADAQLRELGIEATPEELSLHRQLVTQPECSRDFIEKAEAWLRRIRIGAEQTRRYDLAALDTVLAQVWTDACLAAAGLGWWTWRQHRRSPLCSGSAAGLAWRTTRGEVKQRFPRLARTLKGGNG